MVIIIGNGERWMSKAYNDDFIDIATKLIYVIADHAVTDGERKNAIDAFVTRCKAEGIPSLDRCQHLLATLKIDADIKASALRHIIDMWPVDVYDRAGAAAVDALGSAGVNTKQAVVSLIGAIRDALASEPNWARARAAEALGYVPGRKGKDSYSWTRFLEEKMPLTHSHYVNRRVDIGGEGAANEMRRRFRLAFGAFLIGRDDVEITPTTLRHEERIYDSVARDKMGEKTGSLDTYICEQLGIERVVRVRAQRPAKETTQQNVEVGTFALLAIRLIDHINGKSYADDNGNPRPFGGEDAEIAKLLVDVVKEHMPTVVRRKRA
jgi:hypothetical protein